MRIINKIIFSIFDWLSGGDYIPTGEEKPTKPIHIIVAVILATINWVGIIWATYYTFIK